MFEWVIAEANCTLFPIIHMVTYILLESQSEIQSKKLHPARISNLFGTLDLET